MIYVSEIKTDVPNEFKTDLQTIVYATLERLAIPFQRVDTAEAVTMEDCVQINHRLNMKMVKTLFLCNRQKTDYYLFVTPGDKPFKSRDFSDALGVSRLSFAPAELMDTMLGTKIGAATIFSAQLESAGEVTFVFDDEVAQKEWYGCSDGTTTGYMKVKTEAITDVFFPFTKRQLAVVKV